jgi:ABC-2 type transport system permease protein
LDVTNVTVAVFNRDTGEQSWELIQRVRGAPYFTKVITLLAEEEIAHVIDTQQAFMVIHFDEQFSRNILARKPALIQVILDARKSNSAQIVQGYFADITDQYNRDLAARYNIPTQPTRLVQRNWYNPNLNYRWYTVPCLVAILTLSISLLVTALSVARERELGTFDQLLVSPIQTWEILLGKAIPAVIIAMGEGSFMVLCAVFIFGVPLTGSLWLLYPAMFVFACSIIGVGLFISSLCTTQQQAILGAFVFMSPAVLLSGFATPIENIPVWMQYITLANPLRYFLVIVKGVFLKEMHASAVLWQIWPMIIIAAFTLSIAGWLFRKRLE